MHPATTLFGKHDTLVASPAGENRETPCPGEARRSRLNKNQNKSRKKFMRIAPSLLSTAIVAALLSAPVVADELTFQKERGKKRHEE